MVETEAAVESLDTTQQAETEMVETSTSKPDEPGLRRIQKTERFQAKLAEVVRPEEIPHWLDTPNDAFDGLKPLEVIKRGEIDRFWNMIYYPESGVAS